MLAKGALGELLNPLYEVHSQGPIGQSHPLTLIRGQIVHDRVRSSTIHLIEEQMSLIGK